MNPRLIAISGSRKGTVFTLTEPETSIGREITNAICLNEPSVSRRHSLIQLGSGEMDSRYAEPQTVQSQPLKEPEGQSPLFRVLDLDSYNGTFVNGVPIKEQLLQDGDQISVGDSVLLF